MGTLILILLIMAILVLGVMALALYSDHKFIEQFKLELAKVRPEDRCNCKEKKNQDGM